MGLFKEIAAGLAMKSKSESQWEEIPVDIEEFITSPRFLDLKYDYSKGRGCRPKILEIAKEVMAENVRESMLLLGKGSGKDFICSILHLYGIYKCLCLYSPQTYYGISPNSPIYFVNVARNETQAKNVFFAEFKGMLERCAWFEGKYRPPKLQVVTFIKRIKAISGNSQAAGWLGYNTLQWVGDEIAFFLSNDKNEGSSSMAEESWEAAKGSCKTRYVKHYKMIGITTPNQADDFVMRKFEELKGRSDGYAVQAPTWDVNPKLTKADFAIELATNYRRTMRDFGAEPVGYLESFWSDPHFMESSVCDACRFCPVYERRKSNFDPYVCQDYDDCRRNLWRGNGEWLESYIPDRSAEYVMHFDLSKNKDRVGLCVGHVTDMIQVEIDPYTKAKMLLENDELSDISEISDNDKYIDKPLIMIDAVGHIDPRGLRDTDLLYHKEIHFETLLTKVLFPLVAKGFNIVNVSFDSFQSVDIRQRVETKGIEAEIISTDITDEVPNTAKTALVEGRVDFPYDKVLCAEASKLQVVGGKKVDHPKGSNKGDGLGNSKDVWDAVAVVVYKLESMSKNSGGFEGLTNGDED